MFGQSNMVGSVAKTEDINRKVKEKRSMNAALYNTSDNHYDDDLISNSVNLFTMGYSIDSGSAYEYKYLTNSLVDLYNNGLNIIRFGEVILASNNEQSTQMSSGTNIIPYFAKAYVGETGYKLAIVHAAIGGKQIECFLPSTGDNDYKCYTKKNIYETMVKKYKAAINKLQKNGYTIDNTFYIVFQGEADSNSSGYKGYYDRFMKVHKNLKTDLGLKFGAIIYTAKQPSNLKDKNQCIYVDKIHKDQANLIKNNDDIMLASDWGYRRYSEGYLNAFGLEKHTYTENGKKIEVGDNTIHFTALSLSKIGIDSAMNISKRINNSNYNTSYTGYTKECT